MDNKLNKALFNDLVSAHDYQDNNQIDSHFILLNPADRNTYFISYRHNDNINDLIANLELALTELKMRTVMLNMQDNDEGLI